MTGEFYFRVGARAGSATLDLSRDLLSWSLESQAGRPAEVTLRLPDPTRILGHALQEGLEIEVELGTSEAHRLVFRGLVHGAVAELPEDAAPALRLTAYDGAMRMGLRRRSRRWAGLTIGGIVTNVAKTHGFLGIDVRLREDCPVPGEGLRQVEETDLAFLLRLAETWACELWVDPAAIGETLHFVSRALLWEAGPRLTLVYGRVGVEHALRSFEAESSIGGVGPSRLLAGVDGRTGEPVRIASPLGGPPEVQDPFLVESLAREYEARPERARALEQLVAAAPRSRASLEERLGIAELESIPGLLETVDTHRARAANLAVPRSLGMEASGRVDADVPLRIGEVARVLGVGGRASGAWLVTRVRHSVGEEGRTLDFRCVR